MSLAHEIARHYGQGKEGPNGNGGWVTCCPVHGDKTPSMSIWDDGKGGVNVDCKLECKWEEIKDRFRNDGVLPEWKPATGKHQKATSKQEPKKDNKNNSRANWTWKKKAAADSDKHIKGYFATRAIILDIVHKCFKLNSYQDKETKKQVNLILAAISQPGDEKVQSIHRLYLDMDNAYACFGKWKLLGSARGKGVWFERQGNLSTIAIGEGIETTLSVTVTMKMNGVAAISASGMKALVTPEDTKTIYILVDSDVIKETKGASMAGQKAAYTLAKKFTGSREDRIAYLVTPNDSCFSENPVYEDFNDLLKADPTGASIKSRFDKKIKFEDLEWEPSSLEPEERKLPENDIKAELAMFERFVFLASDNKIIDTFGHDIKDSMMVPQAFTISQAGTYHNYIDEYGNPKEMPLTKYWLMSEAKKVASSLEYKPGEDILFEDENGRHYYNSFRLPYQLSPGLPEQELQERLKNWHKIMETVFHEHRSYIEDFFSFTLQHPEKRAGIMPVCISGVGLGKSLIMAIMSRVVGHQNFSNGKILDVTGLGRTGTQWGDWIFNKKISCIEEIDPEGETGLAYKILDALKDIITNETLSLNLKGGRNGTFPVYANIIGFSNHKNCVKIPYGDRRLFVVDSTNQKLLSCNEYSQLWDWIRDKRNILAVYQYLLSRSINDEFVPGQAKMTNAKRSLQVDGRNPLQTAFDLVIEQYPCDLVTNGELQLAVVEALKYIEGEETDYASVNWNAEKQFQAIMKTTTTLVAAGKRIRVQREGGQKLNPSLIRAVRNGQDWIGATTQDIKDAMFVEIPWKWIKEDEDNYVPF